MRALALSLLILLGLACAPHVGQPIVAMPCGDALPTHAEDDVCVSYVRADGVLVVSGPLSSHTPEDGPYTILPVEPAAETASRPVL